jgi:hypothetical protein
MAKSPAGRYPSCQDFAAGLATACGVVAVDGVTERLPRRNPQPESDLVQNFLRPGSPGPSRWPAQPPPSGLDGMGRGTWPPPAGRVPPSRGRRSRRTGRTVTVVILVAIFVLGVVGAVAYRLANRQHASTPPPAATKTVTIPPPLNRADPRTIVREFFAAINTGRYYAAWRLTAETEPYATFAKGFAGTAHDTLTINSVTGDVVTAHLTALQTDGTVKYYKGTYTVTNGVISSTNVLRIG